MEAPLLVQDDVGTIRAFVAAGSYETSSAPAPETLRQHWEHLAADVEKYSKSLRAEAASQTDSSTTQAAVAGSMETLGTSQPFAPVPADDTAWASSHVEYATKFDVSAMINARLASLSVGNEARKQHEHPHSNGRHWMHGHAHGQCHGSHVRHSKSHGRERTKGEHAMASAYRHNAICDACDNYILGARYKCLDCPDHDSCETCWNKVRKEHATHRFVKVADDSLYQALSAKPVHIHCGVLCDGPMCVQKKTPITGDRYKCVVCTDFDLCAACEASPRSQHRQDHPMIKIKTPLSNVNVSFDHDKVFMDKDPLPADPVAKSFARTGSTVPRKTRPQEIDPSAELKEVFTNIGAKVRNALASPEVGANLGEKVRNVLNGMEAGKNLPVRHLTVACDNCDRMVCGTRFMCATCRDFDLCESCYTDRQHPATHVFVRYNQFVNNIITPRLHFDAVVTTATVDSHKGFYCNECHRAPIAGLRYHCLVCRDYDSCENCKDMSHSSSFGTERHMREHAMQIIPSRANSALDAGVSASSGQVDRNEDVPSFVASAKSSVAPIPAVTSAMLDDSKISSETDVNSLSADFLEDVSIPDGAVVTKAAKFVKQWLVRNDGPVAWPKGIKAVFVGGVDLTNVGPDAEKSEWTATELEVAVQPGQATVVSVFLQAPDTEKDNVVSYFKLVTPTGHRFGCKLWVDIDVRANGLHAPTRGSAGQEESVSPKNEDLTVSQESKDGNSDEVPPLTASSDASTHSAMIFPSASMELPKSGPPSNDSISNPETQHEWGSEDEITLSSDEDYDILDDESFSEDN